MGFVYRYGIDHDRSFLKDYILDLDSNNKKILDVGCDSNLHSLNPEWLDNLKNVTTLDLFDFSFKNKNHFSGNISLYNTWLPLINYVNKNGKFDFCYMSHTLEDVANPQMVCNILSTISLSGFIATPSKYAECARLGNNKYRGYIHHRWIFNIENNKFFGYPKQGFIEFEDYLDTIANKRNNQNEELQIFWTNKIELNVINNDFLGPNESVVKVLYKNLNLN